MDIAKRFSDISGTQRMSANSGVLIVDKPENLTSFSVDSYVKKALNCKKVGHAGTIDPFATGVLPLLINSATKMQDYFLNIPKTYEGAFKLGIFTDTLDVCGNAVGNSKDISDADLKNVAEYLQGLKGDIVQKTPAYSAKKFHGVPYYKYARKNNIPVSAANMTSSVHIYDFEILSIKNPFIYFRCAVSKGTYIRAFAQDIMDKFNIPAHLFSLRRTSAGGFDISEAVSFAELAKGKDFILSKLISVLELDIHHNFKSKL
jgi:tRNA pseudouridine55 synthase